MAKLYNLARMTTATVGTGAITLGAAVSGYLTFAGAGVQDGETVVYGIKDGANSEIGTGVYTAAGTTLTRTVRKSTNANAAISLSGGAEVFITVGAEDILVPANNLSDVASVTTARQNLNVQPPQCGLLQVNSATQIAFIAKNGNKVQVAGTIFSLGSSGVTAANTGVFVNGASGQNLAANTAYLVCVFNNSGTLALDFMTSLAHQVSSASGNEGVEIKNGDNTRTVVGLIVTDGAAHFQDNTGFRGCLSWFNKRWKDFELATTNNTTTSTTPATVTSTITVAAWVDGAICAFWDGQTQTSAVPSALDCCADNATVMGNATQTVYPIAANPITVKVGGFSTLADGAHTIGGRMWTGGSGTVVMNNSFINGATWG